MAYIVGTDRYQTTDTPESEVKDEKNPETDEEDTQKLSDEEKKFWSMPEIVRILQRMML